MRFKSLAFLMAGVLIGILAERLSTPHIGRYVVMNVGPVDAPHPLRLDTETGKTWLFQGGWVESKELAPVVARSADYPASSNPP